MYIAYLDIFCFKKLIKIADAKYIVQKRRFFFVVVACFCEEVDIIFFKYHRHLPFYTRFRISSYIS